MKNLINETNISAMIEDISWDGILLNIQIRVKNINPDVSSLEFFLVSKTHADAEFKITDINSNLYYLTLNITNQGERRCVAAGAYSLLITDGDNIIARAQIVPSLANRLADCSRSFLYREEKGMYCVAFYVEESDFGLPLKIHIVDDAVTVKGRYTDKRLQRIHSLMTLAYHILSSFYRAIHVKKKYILFFSEKSGSIGSNQEPLMRRIKERNPNKKLRIEEFYSSGEKDRLGMRTRIREINCLAKSSIIIAEDHSKILDWLKLRNDTKLIMLWHAGTSFKGLGYTRWGQLRSPAPWCCHRQYTYVVSPSSGVSGLFAEMFGINKSQVLPTGMPRIDIYANPDRKKKVSDELKLRYPLINGKKIILFAPTFRGADKKTAHYPYEIIDFEGLSKVCGDEYAVLFRMHPWVQAPVPIPEECRGIMADTKDYPSINDLFYVTDLLISDYSSGVFEYSLMKKPALFFAFDEIQYSLSRGFQHDYRSAVPGKVCSSFDELLHAIEERDFEFEKMETYFKHNFGTMKTGACDRVIDWMILDRMPEEFKDRIAQDEAAAKRRKNLLFPEI